LEGESGRKEEEDLHRRKLQTLIKRGCHPSTDAAISNLKYSKKTDLWGSQRKRKKVENVSLKETWDFVGPM